MTTGLVYIMHNVEKKKGVLIYRKARLHYGWLDVGLWVFKVAASSDTQDYKRNGTRLFVISVDLGSRGAACRGMESRSPCMCGMDWNRIVGITMLAHRNNKSANEFFTQCPKRFNWTQCQSPCLSCPMVIRL